MFSKAVRLMALVLLALPAAAQGTQDPPEGPHVVVVRVDGMIDEGIAVLVKRAVAEAQDAKAMIFVIDTFGGRVDSAVDIASSIMDAPCPTVAFVVGKGAISAGALISFACDDIVMKPGTNFGAAQPVLMQPVPVSPEGPQPTGEKEVSFVRQKMRALAEENGHNADIAEAMVDERVVLRARVVDGKVKVEKVTNPEYQRPSTDVEDAAERLIESLGENAPEGLREFLKSVGNRSEQSAKPAVAPPPGEPSEEIIDGYDQLLTLTSKSALLYGLIPLTANSIGEVADHFGYGELPRYEVSMTWGEQVFRFLTNPFVAPLLLMAGLAGIYFEIKAPGFGLPGILGITCLALFFGAHYVIGLVNLIDIVLVVVGVGLILAEIFVIPGFGIAGISGIACIVLGLYLSLTKVGIPEYSWDYERMRGAVLTISVALGALVVFIALILRILPQTPIYRRVVLENAQVAALGYSVQSERDRESAVGLTGIAATVLRPAGRGRFGGKTYSVVSRAEYIDEGTPIVIVEVEGNRYVVDKADALRAS